MRMPQNDANFGIGTLAPHAMIFSHRYPRIKYETRMARQLRHAHNWRRHGRQSEFTDLAPGSETAVRRLARAARDRAGRLRRTGFACPDVAHCALETDA